MNNQPKKKSKGKIILIVVCAILGLAAIGYATSGNKNGEDGSQTSNTPAASTASTASTVPAASTASDDRRNSLRVDEKSVNSSSETKANEVSKVVYDKNGIKITYKGLENNYNITTSIKFFIENNNTETYTVQTTDVTIDDYTMSTIMSTKVAAGKKANDTIAILSTNLEDNGMSYDTITNAEIGLVIWSESDILNQTNDKITFSLR